MPEAYIDYRNVALDRLRMVHRMVGDDVLFTRDTTCWMHLYVDDTFSYFLPFDGSESVH